MESTPPVTGRSANPSPTSTLGLSDTDAEMEDASTIDYHRWRKRVLKTMRSVNAHEQIVELVSEIIEKLEAKFGSCFWSGDKDVSKFVLYLWPYGDDSEVLKLKSETSKHLSKCEDCAGVFFDIVQGCEEYMNSVTMDGEIFSKAMRGWDKDRVAQLLVNQSPRSRGIGVLDALERLGERRYGTIEEVLVEGIVNGELSWSKIAPPPESDGSTSGPLLPECPNTKLFAMMFHQSAEVVTWARVILDRYKDELCRDDGNLALLEHCDVHGTGITSKVRREWVEVMDGALLDAETGNDKVRVWQSFEKLVGYMPGSMAFMFLSNQGEGSGIMGELIDSMDNPDTSDAVWGACVRCITRILQILKYRTWELRVPVGDSINLRYPFVYNILHERIHRALKAEKSRSAVKEDDMDTEPDPSHFMTGPTLAKAVDALVKYAESLSLMDHGNFLKVVGRTLKLLIQVWYDSRLLPSFKKTGVSMRAQVSALTILDIDRFDGEPTVTIESDESLVQEWLPHVLTWDFTAIKTRETRDKWVTSKADVLLKLFGYARQQVEDLKGDFVKFPGWILPSLRMVHTHCPDLKGLDMEIHRTLSGIASSVAIGALKATEGSRNVLESLWHWTIVYYRDIDNDQYYDLYSDYTFMENSTVSESLAGTEDLYDALRQIRMKANVVGLETRDSGGPALAREMGVLSSMDAFLNANEPSLFTSKSSQTTRMLKVATTVLATKTPRTNNLVIAAWKTVMAVLEGVDSAIGAHQIDRANVCMSLFHFLTQLCVYVYYLWANNQMLPAEAAAILRMEGDRNAKWMKTLAGLHMSRLLSSVLKPKWLRALKKAMWIISKKQSQDGAKVEYSHTILEMLRGIVHDSDVSDEDRTVLIGYCPQLEIGNINRGTLDNLPSQLGMPGVTMKKSFNVVDFHNNDADDVHSEEEKEKNGGNPQNVVYVSSDGEDMDSKPQQPTLAPAMLVGPTGLKAAMESMKRNRQSSTVQKQASPDAAAAPTPDPEYIHIPDDDAAPSGFIRTVDPAVFMRNQMRQRQVEAEKKAKELRDRAAEEKAKKEAEERRARVEEEERKRKQKADLLKARQNILDQEKRYEREREIENAARPVPARDIDIDEIAPPIDDDDDDDPFNLQAKRAALKRLSYKKVTSPASDDEDGKNGGNVLDDLAFDAASSRPAQRLPIIPREKRRTIALDPGTAMTGVRGNRMNYSGRPAPRKIVPKIKAEESLLEQLLLWDPRQVRSDSVELKSDKLKRVQNSYSDENEYASVYAPLLVEECYAQLVSEMNSMERERPSGTFVYFEHRRESNLAEIIIRPVAAHGGVVDDLSDISDMYLVMFEQEVVKPSTPNRKSSSGIQSCKPFFALRREREGDKDWSKPLRFVVRAEVAAFMASQNVRITWRVKRIANLVTNLRECQALDRFLWQGDRYPLRSWILGTDPDVVGNRKMAKSSAATILEKPTCSGLVNMLQKTLNSSQMRSIREVVRLENGAQLIEGPPGTGKTTTIIGVLSVLLAKRRDGGRGRSPILMCAPSNAAVDEVARRVMNVGLYQDNGTRLNPRICRLGQLSSIADDVKSIALDTLAQHDVNQANADGEEAKGLEELENMKTLAELNLAGLEEQLHALCSGKGGSDHMSRQNKEVQTVRSKIFDARNSIKEVNSRLETARNAGMEKGKRSRRNILAGADIIFCTLSGSAQKAVRTMDISMDTVVIDEAAQSVETSTLVSMQYGCKRVIMIGDSNQLPATVISKRAEKLGYDKSLFERWEALLPRTARTMLEEQYRMHSEIVSFPSSHVYDGRLKTAQAVMNRPVWTWVGIPFAVFDIRATGSQPDPSVKTLSNPAEANHVLAYIQWICDRIPLTGEGSQVNIGVITPYQGQKRMIKSMVRNIRGPAVEVNTVDGFQGREMDIIVLSTVRSMDHRGVGFLASRRRMNVSLTRARHGLVVFGDVEGLRRDPDWAALVNNADTRGLLFRPDGKLFTARRIDFERILKGGMPRQVGGMDKKRKAPDSQPPGSAKVPRTDVRETATTPMLSSNCVFSSDEEDAMERKGPEPKMVARSQKPNHAKPNKRTPLSGAAYVAMKRGMDPRRTTHNPASGGKPSEEVSSTKGVAVKDRNNDRERANDGARNPNGQQRPSGVIPSVPGTSMGKVRGVDPAALQRLQETQQNHTTSVVRYRGGDRPRSTPTPDKPSSQAPQVRHPKGLKKGDLLGSLLASTTNAQNRLRSLDPKPITKVLK